MGTYNSRILAWKHVLECEVTFEKHDISGKIIHDMLVVDVGGERDKAALAQSSAKVHHQQQSPSSLHFCLSHNLSQAALSLLKYLTEHCHHLPWKAQKKRAELSLDVTQQSCSLRWRKTKQYFLISSWACGLSSIWKCHLFCSINWTGLPEKLQVAQKSETSSFDSPSPSFFLRYRQP